LEEVADLLDSQTDKESELHHLCLAWINGGEVFQGSMEVGDLDAGMVKQLE